MSKCIQQNKNTMFKHHKKLPEIYHIVQSKSRTNPFVLTHMITVGKPGNSYKDTKAMIESPVIALIGIKASVYSFCINKS